MASSVKHCTLNDKGLKHYQKRVKAVKGGQVDSTLKNYANAKLPAHKAAFEGDIPGLEAIFISKVESGGIPAADKGITPLHMAIKGSKMEVIKWLLRFTTASVFDRTKDGKSTIHAAIEQGNLECLKLLLSSVDKSLKDQLCTLEEKSGLTCLLLAIQKHQNKVFKLLVSELGAKSVTHTNSSGVSAAHVAASIGNFEVLNLLANKYNKMLHEKTRDGCTPVYYAAQEGQLEALSFLHETAKCSLADPTVTDGFRPIHVAARSGHIHIMEYIISKHGAVVLGNTTADGSTPLHVAVSSGNLDTVRWLIACDKSGVTLSTTNDCEATPAHNAAEAGHGKILKFLLENGANIQATNKKGDTPLSLAMKINTPEMAALVDTIHSDPDEKINVSTKHSETLEAMEEAKLSEKPETISVKEDLMSRNNHGATEETKELEPTENPETTDLSKVDPIYSTPDPNVVAQKRLAKGNDIPPPVPEQTFDKPENSNEKNMIKKTSVLQKWPYAASTDEPLKKEPPAPRQPSLSILEKWSHAKLQNEPTAKKEPVVPKPSQDLKSKWPPPKEEALKSTKDLPNKPKQKWPPTNKEKEEEEQKEMEEKIEEQQEPLEEKVEEKKQEVEELPKPFVKLRRTVIEPKQLPESLSGAGSELKEALLKRKKE